MLELKKTGGSVRLIDLEAKSAQKLQHYVALDREIVSRLADEKLEGCSM